MARLGHRAYAFTSDSNHLVIGPSFEGAQHRREVDGVCVTWLRTLKYRGAKSVGRMLSWFDFERRLSTMPTAELPRPDVVIASSLSLFSILSGLRFKRKYGCKLIFEVRDIWPLTICEEGGISSRHPFVRLLAAVEKLAYHKADAIVGTMPNLCEHVLEVAGPNTPPVHCIPMGIDPSQLDVAEQLPEGYVHEFLPEDKFIVCHAGTIGITNALDTLFECATRMADDDRVQFVVVGKGDLKSTYQDRYGHLPNVTFAPAVPKPQVQSVLSHCDLLYFAVHKSAVWRFGQSLNKVTDYMLAGKPVLASYTGYPSMIDEAGAGKYVPADDIDALRAAIIDFQAKPAEERVAMGRAGRTWLVENRAYPVLAKRYLDIVENLLEKRTLPHPRLGEGMRVSL
jgi:glycosyltransferase involved in cell wall biosynthesis